MVYALEMNALHMETNEKHVYEKGLPEGMHTQHVRLMMIIYIFMCTAYSQQCTANTYLDCQWEW